MDIPNTSKSYAACLISFMSFIDGVQYNPTSAFSREQLLAIMADQVAAYLYNKAYGMPTPGLNDHPNQGRLNSLAFHKRLSPI